jgi:hypothetical protein
MKLYATLKNERGGKKSTGDDTRILVELSYKNKIVGTVGLYVIKDWPTGQEVGYRITLDNEVIREEEQKMQDTCKHENSYVYNTIRGKRCRKCDENPF